MFQGGGHGLEIRDEGGQQFLYVSAYVQSQVFAKLDLNGEVVWVKHAPMESGHLRGGRRHAPPTARRGRDRFLPTNFAFLPDGGFLLADGYGSFYIHRYDHDGNWLNCFGGPGEATMASSTIRTACRIDDRPGREPRDRRRRPHASPTAVVHARRQVSSKSSTASSCPCNISTSAAT